MFHFFLTSRDRWLRLRNTAGSLDTNVKWKTVKKALPSQKQLATESSQFYLMSNLMILLKLDFVRARKFRRAEDTGDTLASPMTFWASQLHLAFTDWMFGGVRAVFGRPECVGPGLDFELQLFTVPFFNCFFQIFRIMFVPGLRTPGYFAWNASRILSLKHFVPLCLWYSKARKFRWSRVNCSRGGILMWTTCWPRRFCLEE